MSLTGEDKEWILAQLAPINKKIESLEVKIERVETSLLTEFHKWASPLEMRVRSHSTAIRAMDLEIEAIGDRVTKLEPPH